FRVVRFHCRRSNHHVRAIGVGSAMALKNRRAQFLEPFRDARKLRIRPRDGITERQKNFGDAAHTDTADSDKMNTLKIAKGDHHGFALARIACTFAASSIRLTMSHVARGRASARALEESFSICSG